MQIEDYLYQKMYQPLTGKSLYGMKQTNWELLDQQALGVIQLTLAKNVAFNILNEKTTIDLMKTLSNMYEKPSADLMKPSALTPTRQELY
uniref:Retrovirus-related Pol polyprotein from transposon TNT 1-94 n=1 Tax=Cajanus cajan TaxID=3821 RepID=A0A151UHS8_CAJCA